MSPGTSALSAWLLVWPALVAGAAGTAAALAIAGRPLFVRYALACPAGRAGPGGPTARGGGVAVLAAASAAAAAGAMLVPLTRADAGRLGGVIVGAGVLALLGFIDDLRPLPRPTRLLVQLACMAAGVLLLPAGTRLFAWMPLAAEQALLVLVGAWFIALTVDTGETDWMTVIGIGPALIALSLFWATGAVSAVPGLLALGLLGGIAGFASFNAPPARLVLGGVGSRPLGFLAAYGVFALGGSPTAGAGALAGALILPLSVVADGAMSVLRRHDERKRGRKLFHQVAAQRDGSASVLIRMGVANAALLWLAVIAVEAGQAAIAAGALALAATVVGVLLITLAGKGRDAAVQR